jgi:hypothetical protein
MPVQKNGYAAAKSCFAALVCEYCNAETADRIKFKVCGAACCIAAMTERFNLILICPQSVTVFCNVCITVE